MGCKCLTLYAHKLPHTKCRTVVWCSWAYTMTVTFVHSCIAGNKLAHWHLLCNVKMACMCVCISVCVIKIAQFILCSLNCNRYTLHASEPASQNTKIQEVFATQSVYLEAVCTPHQCDHCDHDLRNT